MIFVITVIIIGTVLWCWRDLKRTQAEQVAECAATTESNELTQTEVEVPSYVTVFQEYRESDPWVAMLVMRNALTRFKDSLELFITYMDYLFLMAAQTDGLEYLEEARSVMLQYGEHAAIKDFPKIVSYRERIYQLEQTFYAKSLELLQQGNTEILLQLQHYLGQLREVDTEKAFQTVLQSVAHIEEDLDLDTLTPEQSGLYANLKREFVETAELLSSSLEHERHKTYNADVIKIVREVFDVFRENERDFVKGKRSVSELMGALATANPHYLSTETLTYFNHVYGYIFNRIGEEDKYDLTRLMTQSTKDVVR